MPSANRMCACWKHWPTYERGARECPSLRRDPAPAQRDRTTRRRTCDHQQCQEGLASKLDMQAIYDLVGDKFARSLMRRRVDHPLVSMQTDRHVPLYPIEYEQATAESYLKPIAVMDEWQTSSKQQPLSSIKIWSDEAAADHGRQAQIQQISRWLCP